VEWVVTTARTVEEARESALDRLGVDEQEAEVEVLQEPQKGLFGRVRTEAQVRARVRPNAPRPKAERRDRRRRDRSAAGRGGDGRNGKGRGGNGRGGNGRSGRSAAPSNAKGDTASVSAAVTDDKRKAATGGSAPSGDRTNKGRRRSGTGRTQQGARVSESTRADAAPGAPLDVEGQRAAVEKFLVDLLVAFGRSDATVSVEAVDDDTLEAKVEGSELGLLVGQKGVTLQAVQELVRSMVQRRFVGQSHARIRVDVAGYRARRKEALEKFTREVAESVLASGTAKRLDPMSSADRKVVHDAVNELEGVRTESRGDDPDRHVVILPE
jgi:spoIIIJ-associated protein